LKPTGGRRIVDPAALGSHKFGGGDSVGQVYTCKGGFLDFGHVRELMDLTVFYHQQLTKGGKSKVGDIIKHDVPAAVLLNGYTVRVAIKKLVLETEANEIARAMAYDQSVFYEIFTYWIRRPGGHHSAFSPEDLVSNYLGTYVAAKALARTNEPFDVAATAELKTAMDLLSARTPEETLAAFEKIKGKWVLSVDSKFDMTKPGYLRRRNFNVRPIDPCLVLDVPGCVPASFPIEIPTQIADRIYEFYDVEYSFSEVAAFADRGPFTMRKSDFAAQIARIKADASRPIGEGGYGPDFESCAS
jgi:hypothetical protein